MGDVLAREGIEDDRILDRTLAGGIAVDLGERDDLAHVSAGVKAARLEALVIGRRLGRYPEEARHQSLLARVLALFEQRLRMIRILAVLVSIKAAYMPGDELVLVINADPLRIGFDDHALVRELGWHRVAIGVERDAELTRGAQVQDSGEIVRIRVRPA